MKKNLLNKFVPICVISQHKLHEEIANCMKKLPQEFGLIFLKLKLFHIILHLFYVLRIVNILLSSTNLFVLV